MRRSIAFLALLILAPLAAAQGTKADYDRANSVGKWTAGKVTSAKVEANWTPDGKQFWYQNAKRECVLVDVMKRTREVVSKDKLPKDAKPAAPPRKGPRPPEASETEGEHEPGEASVRAQPPFRRGGTSPDGKWTAFVKDNNVWLRDTKTKEETQLSRTARPMTPTAA